MSKKTVKILAYKTKGSGSILAHLISFLLDSPYYHYELLMEDTRVVATLGKKVYLDEFDSKIQSLIMKKKIKVIYLPPLTEIEFHSAIYFIKENLINKSYDWISLVNNYISKYKKDWAKNRFNCIEATLSIINFVYNKQYDTHNFKEIARSRTDVWKAR